VSETTATHDRLILEQFTQQATPFAELPLHTQAESLDLLRDGLRPRGSERVLDAGCGPGLVARFLAPLVREVIGVDATPAMVDKAREIVAAEGITNARFAHGTMEQLPLADAAVDAVVTRFTFHHLLAPARALDEIRRVCRPGGRVVLCDAAPTARARAAYDDWERLRDASHTSALTADELRALAVSVLDDVEVRCFRLPIAVRELLASSFSRDADELYRRMAADVGRDTMDMAAHQDGSTLMMSFPVCVVSGTRRSG
jgi:ubiquinone/menaquinone biosynthesis C-methylase UbiE